MDLATFKSVLTRTHLAALNAGIRASGYHAESGPGIGKTDSVHQSALDLAIAVNQPVGIVDFMLATISSVDVRGFMLPIKPEVAGGAMGTVFSTPPWYPTLANTSVVEPNGTVHAAGTWKGDVPYVGILFLDEFSQAEDDVKKPAAELIYKGSVGTAVLPLGWRVVAAGNRMTDRSGVMRELMFIVNRRCKLSINPSVVAWIDYQNALPADKRAHYLTMSFAQKNPGVVFQDAVPDGSDPYCTPRSLCMMDKDLRALRLPEDIQKNRLPIDPIAREVSMGWIGQGATAQFYTHLRYHDELPDMADIEKAPDKAKVPTAKDAQMVAGYMLAHHANGANGDAVLTYIGRLQAEMQVLAVRAILAQKDHAASVINTPKMVQWLAKNRDLLVASRS